MTEPSTIENKLLLLELELEQVTTDLRQITEKMMRINTHLNALSVQMERQSWSKEAAQKLLEIQMGRLKK